MEVISNTQRLIIRQFALSDAEFIVRLLNEESFIRFIAFPDLGYAFLAEFCGKGYAFEAAKNTLTATMRACSLDTVLAVTFPENLRSNNLLDKVGFNCTKKMQLYGLQNNLYEYRDSVSRKY